MQRQGPTSCFSSSLQGAVGSKPMSSGHPWNAIIACGDLGHVCLHQPVKTNPRLVGPAGASCDNAKIQMEGKSNASMGNKAGSAFVAMVVAALRLRHSTQMKA